MSNIDDELNEKFRELFSTPKEDDKSSPLLQKIQEINIQKFVSSAYSQHSDNEYRTRFPFSTFERSKIINDMFKRKFDISQSIAGKHFQINNDVGVNTVIFRVIPKVDYSSKSWFSDLEELMSSTQYCEDDKSYQIFFIDDPAIGGEDLIFLHFQTLSGEVYVNQGRLVGDVIRVSTKPLVCRIDKTKFKRQHNRNLYADNISENYEIWYDANSDAEVYIFDPDTGKPVLRDRFWNDDKECFQYRIKLEPHKSYFSFKLRYISNNDDRYPLSDLEIGRYYRTGMYGFPKDVMEALRYLENLNLPESDYEIAEILIKEEKYADHELGVKYLKKSADNGFSPACVELAILYSTLDRDKYTEFVKRYIDCAVRDEFAPALFLKAFSLETGYRDKIDMNQSFQLYYQAAQIGYYPAKCRFAVKNGAVSDDPDMIYVQFLESAECEPEYAYFCLGMMLLHNNYISWKDMESHHVEPFEEEGFQIMLKSALMGCKEAFYQVATAYYFGLGVPENDEKALAWFGKIRDDDRIYYPQAINLFMSKKEVFDFSDDEIAVYEKAAKYESQGRFYNELGLYYRMHEKKEEAIMNFQKAIEKGCALACYYLADMYSQESIGGDDEEVLELYKKGALMGCELCEKKIHEYKHRETEIKEEEIDGSIKVVKENLIDIKQRIAEIDHKSDISFKNLSNEVKDTMDSIGSKVDEVNVRTKDIQEELHTLSAFVKEELIIYIKEQKKQLYQEIKDDLDKNEMVISQSCSNISKYINENIASSKEVDLSKEIEYLKSLFGQAWGIMAEESKISLISASVLWKMSARIKGNFDFSGICISATTALENELKRYFFIGFQEYLEKKYGLPSSYRWKETFENWPEILLSISQKKYKQEWYNYKNHGGEKPKIQKKKDTSFSLGTMPFIFGMRRDEDASNEQIELLRKRLDEYLCSFIISPTNKSAIEVFTTGESGNSFIDKCERIRTEYRNRAAHDEIISMSQAEGCYHEVIGKIESFEYTNEVTGILLQLYQYIM